MHQGAVTQESSIDRGKDVFLDRGELSQMRLRDGLGGLGNIGKIADAYAITRIYM